MIMRIKLCMAVSLMLLQVSTLLAKDYKYETVVDDHLKARIYTLDNGLKVYLSVNKDEPRIYTYVSVRTGSRNDPAETTGLAHYLEHIMFKGTRQMGTSDYVAEKPILDAIEAKYEVYRTLTDTLARARCYREIDSLSQLAARYFIPNEYDKTMALIGAQGSNAFTSTDETSYVENIPSNAVEIWARTQADRFMNMEVRGFHTELEAVYEEYNMNLSNDRSKAYDAMNSKLYPTHPYGTQTTIGTQSHLKNPSIRNVKNYFNRYYVPENVAICMAGDMNPDEVIAIIDKYFGSWKNSGGVNRPEFPEQKPLTQHIDTTVVGQEAELMFMGWRFKNAADRQIDTLEVVQNLLTNGKAGLLDVNVMQQMLAQDVYLFVDAQTDYSTFIFMGQPADNQTLGQLRNVVLAEIERLKKGDFDDNLLQAVINNMKKDHFENLKSNEYRADMFRTSFIFNRPWAEETHKLSRIEKITKQQIVDFANSYFVDNYVCVYKTVGNDTTQKKIDKPAITPIQANRDVSSKFFEELSSIELAPIEPCFVDFGRDMTVSEVKKLPLLYKQNVEDDLFTLAFVYEFGSEDMRGLQLVPGYLEYIGTADKSAAEIKKQFYELACNYSISVGSYSVTVKLSGLNENLPKALALLEDYIRNAKGDKESFDKYVNLLEKSRQDSKTNQQSCFERLMNYACYGPHNYILNTFSVDELRKAEPRMLPDMIRNISDIEHSILYYGPYSEKQIASLIAKCHKTPKKPLAVPCGKEYKSVVTDANQVFIAPYDAKTIYLFQTHDEGRMWNPDETALHELFNEYYGSGMSSVVFQELREARGLAYSVSAVYEEPSRSGDSEGFYTFIMSQNDKLSDCISVFSSIIDTIPCSPSAFEVAKQSLMTKLQSKRTLREDVLYKYISAKRRGIGYDIDKKVYEAVPALTIDDIVDFEKKNIAGKPFHYILLGDEKELDMSVLEKIGPIKRLTLEEIFGF